MDWRVNGPLFKSEFWHVFRCPSQLCWGASNSLIPREEREERQKAFWTIEYCNIYLNLLESFGTCWILLNSWGLRAHASSCELRCLGYTQKMLLGRCHLRFFFNLGPYLNIMDNFRGGKGFFLRLYQLERNSWNFCNTLLILSCEPKIWWLII